MSIMREGDCQTKVAMGLLMLQCDAYLRSFNSTLKLDSSPELLSMFQLDENFAQSDGYYRFWDQFLRKIDDIGYVSIPYYL